MEGEDDGYDDLLKPPSLSSSRTGRRSPVSGEAAPPPGSPPPPSPIRVKLRSRQDEGSIKPKSSSLSKATGKALSSSVKKVFRRKSSNNGSSSSSSGSGQWRQKRNSAPVGTNEGSSLSSAGSSEHLRNSLDFSDVSLFSEPYLSNEQLIAKKEMINNAISSNLPFSNWNKELVIAWLEVCVGVPEWYIAALKHSTQSGAMMESLTEVELSQMLGITNSMHRLKLRLALQEIISITSTLQQSVPFYGDMNHHWISDYWLPSIGLPQYSDIFQICLVDARMLEHLTKKDLRMVLKVLDSSHRNSLQYGISVLKKVNYNRQELETRCANVTLHTDILFWTNGQVIKWVESIGLKDNAHNLINSGIHGGVLALDYDFDAEGLALALQISPANQELRRNLKLEFSTLLSEGTNRSSSESQAHGKIVRRISKKIKMKKKASPSTDFFPLRPTSPVLMSINNRPSWSHDQQRQQSPSRDSESSSTSSQAMGSQDLELMEIPAEMTV